MTSAPTEDPATHQARRSRAGDIALLVVGCIAFVIARSITTSGSVRIDDFEYWLIGIVPAVLLYALSRAADRFGRPPRPSARRLIAMWVIALALFCLGKDLHLYNLARDRLTETLNLGRSANDFGTMLLLTAAAGAITLAGFVRSARNRPAAMLLAFAAVVVIAAMMHLLLLTWR